MGEKQEKEEEQARSRQEGRRKDEAEEEFEQNSLETIPPFSTASRLMAPQITIRKRLSPLPLNNNKVEERRRGERERQESEERDGERRQRQDQMWIRWKRGRNISEGFGASGKRG